MNRKFFEKLLWVSVLIGSLYLFIVVQLWMISGKWRLNIFSNDMIWEFLIISGIAVLGLIILSYSKKKNRDKDVSS